MEEDSSSPERPSVKVTYLERQKRKRITPDHADDLSEQDSHEEETIMKPTTTPDGKAAKTKMSLMKAPESRGPQKIGFHLPGPTSKRPRRDSEESALKISPPPTQKQSLHNRSSSSVSSLARITQQVAAASPTSSKKPLSAISTKSATRPSSRRGKSPDTEMDDDASIAESTSSIGRIRRTEEERLEYFRNQPELGFLETNRAECKRCGRFVALGRQQSYTVRPWENHRQRCDNDDDEGSRPSGSRPRQKTVFERKAILERDPRTEEVTPESIKCRKCKKWIRLSTRLKYAIFNWNKHAQYCYNEIPSDYVTTAARKLQVVNDPQAKAFGVDYVDCASCGNKVNLTGEGDYNLTDWEVHKESCVGQTPEVQPLESTRTSDARPPPSSASTESTLVVPIHGTKRSREDPEVPVDEHDARPTNRPRGEDYEVPTKEPPSSMGWFILPLKAFVRGFRESLKSS